eukprot:5184536-Amphidinium_carterae.2
MDGDRGHATLWICLKCGRYTSKRLTSLARPCNEEELSSQHLSRIRLSKHPSGAKASRHLRLQWVHDLPLEERMAIRSELQERSRPSWAV